MNARLAPRLVDSPAVHLTIVALVGLAAYANSFAVPFQFDDGKIIVENEAVRDLGAFFRAPRLPTRAVGFFTFALNGTLHGTDVTGYHVLNLAIHLAAAACVYALTVLACRRVEPEDPALAESAPAAGVIAALLFVAHPIQTQAVTYVVQRFAALVALFYVGAVLAYVRAAETPSRAARAPLRIVAFALAACALFTKENAVTLPAALLAFDVALLGGTVRDRVARIAPFVVLVAVAAVLFLRPVASAEVAAGEYRPDAPSGVPLWESYLLTQPRVVLSYLRLMLVPVGQNVDHDVPLVASPTAVEFVAPCLALIVALGGPAVVAFRLRRRSALARITLLGIAWFVISLSVESSVIPLADVMFEHRVYLPSIGIFLVVGAIAARAVHRLPHRRRLVAWAAVGAVVLGLGGVALARNAVWRSRLALWSDALAKSPGKARPYVYVAEDHLDRGDPGAAIGTLERAATLPHVVPHVFVNLGVAYARAGDLLRAEGAYREGIARGGGTLPGAHSGIALVLLELGRTREACEHFDAAAKVQPLRPVRDNIASCHFMAGDVARAASEWARLADEDPRDAPVLYNLALAYRALGDEERARAALVSFLGVAGPELASQRGDAERWLGERSGGH